jgi:hypothetical protein
MPYTFNPFTGSFDNAPSVPLVEGVYLPLSGGTVTGNLQVSGTTTLGGATQIGSGVATTFYVEGGYVGVNTEIPNEELTVVGDISATSIIYANGGDSNLWNEVYTSYSTASSTFLTSETDSQTLTFDEETKDLSISNGNTVSLSSLREDLSVYLPLSGGTVTGNLSVLGNLDVGIGETYTLFVNDYKVGINTETPNEELTVVGDISATGVVYADGGSSILWNSVYTSYSTASSTFLTSETDSQTLSFDETTKDLSISNGNTVSLSALVDASAIDTGVRQLTANWESTYNTVSALSAEWSSADEVMVAQVTNADSVTLNRGDVVYTFGATGDVMSVKLASNSSETTSSRTLGVINETIIPNGIGYVTVAGRMDKLAFPHPFVDGEALWLGSTPGTFTNVKPTAPNHGVYLGVVERANNGNGLAYIKVQNGYELNEIHDVLIASVSAGQTLRRNSTNTLWINTDDSLNWDSTYSTVSSLSGDWLTTSYLSTNNVLISGLTVASTISAANAIYTNDKQVVTTNVTSVPGTSAVTTIVAVSALPGTQIPGTLYILV